MALSRYDHYGEPRLHVTEVGAFLIRDVLDEDGKFSGICENAVYQFGGDIVWRVCREGVDFNQIAPFLKAASVLK